MNKVLLALGIGQPTDWDFSYDPIGTNVCLHDQQQSRRMTEFGARS